MAPHIEEFERLVRAYLAGAASWNEVHQFAIEMEWASSVNYPELLREPLEALHMAFLAADERDDPQFRADQSEITKLIEEIDRIKNVSA